MNKKIEIRVHVKGGYYSYDVNNEKQAIQHAWEIQNDGFQLNMEGTEEVEFIHPRNIIKVTAKNMTTKYPVFEFVAI